MKLRHLLSTALHIFAIFWLVFIYFSHSLLPHKLFLIVHFWRFRLSSREFSRSQESADFQKREISNCLITTRNQIVSLNVPGQKQVFQKDEKIAFNQKSVSFPSHLSAKLSVKLQISLAFSVNHAKINKFTILKNLNVSTEFWLRFFFRLFS